MHPDFLDELITILETPVSSNMGGSVWKQHKLTVTIKEHLNRQFVTRVFNRHCVDGHNADFEVCRHPNCIRARIIESRLAPTVKP